METLKEYETKNTELISEIGKISSIMKATKEKYVKLKEKFNTIAKKYKNLKEEKLSKSDVQVGSDTSIDLSLAIEDLQRSKETAEETNLKLCAELDKLREEMGRNEYQIKAVRKANVVLMKQSRCLYHESEENKRLDEEREKELEKYREMKATLQNEKETWTKERGILEEQVKKSAAETARLKRENDEYLLEKNVNQKTLGEKASECVWHSRQIQKLKNENEFLYQQGRKLQVELDFAQMKSLSRVTVKPDESLNVFDKELKKSKDRSDMGTMKEYGTRRLSQGLSESAISSKFDEVMDFAPPVFNNEKIIGNKVNIHYTIPYHTIPYITIPYISITYHTLLYHTIHYHTIHYHTTPYHIIPYITIPYCTVSYHTIPHITIPYHTIHYHTIPYITTPYHTLPYHTIPYHTIHYHTILYRIIPYHTIPYHTIPYHTIPYHTIHTMYRITSRYISCKCSS